jgi:hypothetical protein
MDLVERSGIDREQYAPPPGFGSGAGKEKVRAILAHHEGNKRKN